jgi:predicted ABC-type ATPase
MDAYQAAEGFDVQLIYIGIRDAAMSAERVANRVRAGGTMCLPRRSWPATIELWPI